jgi:hypothetical protein
MRSLFYQSVTEKIVKCEAIPSFDDMSLDLSAA